MDIDSNEIPIYGQQRSARSGYFESTYNHPVRLFQSHGGQLRLAPFPADDWEELSIASSPVQGDIGLFSDRPVSHFFVERPSLRLKTRFKRTAAGAVP